MDATRWLIPNGTLPNSVFSLGGRFLWNDQAQTPNLQFAVFDFGSVKMIFEVTEFKTKGGRDDRVFDKQAAVEPIKIVTAPDVKDPTAARGPGEGIFGELHRLRPLPPAAGPGRPHPGSPSFQRPVPPGQHLLSPGTRRVVRPDAGRLGDNEEVHKTFAWFKEMLVGLGVKLEDATYRLGRVLEFDPAKENSLALPTPTSC